MALQRYTIDGYGQIELNNVHFRREGNIEAQCALSTADFSSTTVAENGMLLAVDKLNALIKKPVDDTFPVAINYSTEHMYDERKPGLKNFYLEPGDFYPRLGYLEAGDIFTTNCLAYDTSDYANQSAIDAALAGVKTTALYGQYCDNGAIQVVNTVPTVGPKLKVVGYTTMPDGQAAAKFQVKG